MAKSYRNLPPHGKGAPIPCEGRDDLFGEGVSRPSTTKGVNPLSPRTTTPTANTPYLVVTQPRRLAAISLAQRVAALLGEPLGRTVGYAIANDSVGGPHTRIVFVTTGYLLQSLLHHTRLWDRLTHLVFDEAHERGLEEDMTLLVVKLKLAREREAAAVKGWHGGPPP